MSNRTVEELQAELAEAYAAARALPEPVAAPHFAGTRVESPTPSPPQDPYAATAEAWLSNEFDFTVPSGLMCRLKKMQVEELVAAGIIDKVTRLPAFAQELIDKAEGVPPAETLEGMAMPTQEQFESLTEILNLMLPLVVVQPRIWPMPEDGEDKVIGLIYPDSVELGDRIAIMERLLGGIKKLDKFRQGSNQPV
jgi:hypothetical protein